MAQELQSNENDQARADSLQQKLQDQGGLSQSTIPTPEESRKKALMDGMRDSGSLCMR